MRRALRIFAVAAKNNLAARMAYRGDFFVGITINVLGELLLPLLTVLIYRSGASFPGWSLYEAMMLQGIFMMSTGLSYALFFGMTGAVMNAVREGSFDLIMIRPAPAALLSVALSVNLENMAVFGSGLLIFLAAASEGHIVVTPAGAVWFAVFFLAGIAVMLSFALLMSATMFKWVGNSRIFEIFETISGFGRYPAAIFPGVFRVLITNVLPVAVLGAVPAALLLGKQPPGSWGLALTALCCAVFLCLGRLAWRVALRSYVSAGG
jgi:ABC-2 type transport system permease protein